MGSLWCTNTSLAAQCGQELGSHGSAASVTFLSLKGQELLRNAAQGHGGGHGSEVLQALNDAS